MKTLDDIRLQPNDRKAIEEAVAILKKQFPVQEVRLFGSKVRGTDDAESDIDLLVLTSRKIDWRERRKMTGALLDLELKYGVVLSLLVIPEPEWRKGLVTVLPIHGEIKEQGIAA